MKVGISIILALFFLCPAVLYSAGDGSENIKKQQIQDLKPEKRICEEHIKAANLLIKEFKFENALLDFKKALLHNPFSFDAYYGLGLCYKRLGLYDKAERELKLGLQFERKIKALELLASIYKYKGKYEKSRDLFLEILAEKPDSKEIIACLEEMEKVDNEFKKKDSKK